jgi:transposase
MECAIRPFVVARKSWLFSTSTRGAGASGNLYSLVESAKINGLEPLDYLKLIFKELPKAKTAEDLEKLLPYRVAEHFEIKTFPAHL